MRNRRFLSKSHHWHSARLTVDCKVMASYVQTTSYDPILDAYKNHRQTSSLIAYDARNAHARHIIIDDSRRITCNICSKACITISWSASTITSGRNEIISFFSASGHIDNTSSSFSVRLLLSTRKLSHRNWLKISLHAGS